MIELIGMIAVALLSLIGVIIQKNGNSKIELLNHQIEELRKESKSGDDKLHSEMIETKVSELKRFLITEMSKIEQKSFIPTENEKRILSEAKDEYNFHGGDSYVDDMYEKLKRENLI